ncbi:hypothetical protein [Paenibacillus sp. SN-8-1]|uniref:hypothetical protein n=1 Tax=Paenibacillus sp. SN-8-1 TaxID=3435409 RepID=UPI003D9A2C35
MTIRTHCDAGCQKPFSVDQFDTDNLHDGIERVSFTCPHCDHRYTAFYTDTEIRKLQERIRRVQRRFADPSDNHEDVAKKEVALRAEIKEKMDALRQRQHE